MTPEERWHVVSRMSPMSARYGPSPWQCDVCLRVMPASAFTDRPSYPLHGESVCDGCQTERSG